MALKHSLEPVMDSRSRILILGTMPGDESLQTQQYYANRQNHFWAIISRVYGVDVPHQYADRVELLLSRHLALWDVLRTAHRRGSLDTDIRNEAPNDLESFLSKGHSIMAIGFNGSKAHQLFNRHVRRQQHLPILGRVRIAILDHGVSG